MNVGGKCLVIYLLECKQNYSFSVLVFFPHIYTHIQQRKDRLNFLIVFTWRKINPFHIYFMRLLHTLFSSSSVVA